MNHIETQQAKTPSHHIFNKKKQEKLFKNCVFSTFIELSSWSG